jgi:hypothetical protein
MIRILGLLIVVVSFAACHPGEGERCNPMLFSDECNSGFACTYPANCPVAFCCPTSGTSSNANCQACPGADGGTTDAATTD